jgi:hypothetical protein
LKLAAAERGHDVHAAVIVDHALDRIGHRIGADHVAGEDLRELLLGLRFQQRLDCAVAQHAERLVGGREHGERPLARERLDEIGGLDGGDEGLVIGGVHRVLDDVLVGVHRRAADHRVIHPGQRHGCRECKRAGGGKNLGACHVVSPRLVAMPPTFLAGGHGEARSGQVKSFRFFRRTLKAVLRRRKRG